MTAPWYFVAGWRGDSPPRSAKRGALAVRCASCLGGVDGAIVAIPPEVVGELAWVGCQCARCHRRVTDPRLVVTVARVLS